MEIKKWEEEALEEVTISMINLTQYPLKVACKQIIHSLIINLTKTVEWAIKINQGNKHRPKTEMHPKEHLITMIIVILDIVIIKNQWGQLKNKNMITNQRKKNLPIQEEVCHQTLQEEEQNHKIIFNLMLITMMKSQNKWFQQLQRSKVEVLVII